MNTDFEDIITEVLPEMLKRIEELEKKLEIHHIMIDHIASCVDPKDMSNAQLKRLNELTDGELKHIKIKDE